MRIPFACFKSHLHRRYNSILQRLSSSPTVTLIHWHHSTTHHNSTLQQVTPFTTLNPFSFSPIFSLPQSADGTLEVFVNKFTCKQTDALLLLKLVTGPLRDIASQIALRDIALDPSATNSPLVTRVFYALLPETTAEQACSHQYHGVFQVLGRIEKSFRKMRHSDENDVADVGVEVTGRLKCSVVGDSVKLRKNLLVRFWRGLVRPFAYLHLLRFLVTSPIPTACSVVISACDLHRHWANLLSIDLEHLIYQNLAALQASLANTAAAAKKCCQDGATGALSLSNIFTETVKFFQVKMSFSPADPAVALVSRREVVSSLLYCTVFLVSLYSFLFWYLKATLLPIFMVISSGIFYLGVSGSILILFTKLFRILIHKKVTTPLLLGQPVFSLLHDAVLLRQSHRLGHLLLLPVLMCLSYESYITQGTPPAAAFDGNTP